MKIIEMSDGLGPACEIPLHGKYGKGKVTLVSPEDWDWASKLRFRADKNRKTFYPSICGYAYNPLHKLLGEKMGCPSGKTMDHINHNGLDNRRGNLRFASSAEQSCNRTRQISNKSGYIGVSYHIRGTKWQTYISVFCKNIYLGYSQCKHEAAAVYNEAAEKYHGEFAVLNQIDYENIPCDCGGPKCRPSVQLDLFASAAE